MVIETARADLDGDGHEEVIQAAFISRSSPALAQCALTVNTVFGQVISGSMWRTEVRVVDIDSTDAFCEILVFDEGPSNDPEVRVFRYAPGVLREIGRVPAFADWPVCDGSGHMRTRTRGDVLHTWFYDCTYSVQPWSGNVEKDAADCREMNQRVTLRVDLPVVSRPGLRPVGTIRRGERAVIVCSDDERWCLIRSDGGVEGWFTLMESDFVVQCRMTASAVFDGLVYAD